MSDVDLNVLVDEIYIPKSLAKLHQHFANNCYTSSALAFPLLAVFEI